MSKFTNATWNDVAAEVVGALTRGDVVNSADLDEWFRGASVDDGFALLKAITEPGSDKLAAASSVSGSDQTDATRAYRKNAQQLNVRLAQQEGYTDFLTRYHENRKAAEVAADTVHDDDGDEDAQVEARLSAFRNIIDQVPLRSLRSLLKRHTTRETQQHTTSWYKVDDVNIVPGEDGIGEYYTQYHKDPETGRWYNGKPVATATRRKELLGEDPEQWIGHLAEITYLHKDDANAALEAAGITYSVESHELKTFKIVD
jgi:hypothetical protein